ncbi:MAG: hypothetical protein ABIH72_00865 [archaeon]
MVQINYDTFKIKRYNLWDLFLHTKQFPYIGRCYAWAKREDAVKIEDMNPKERKELFEKVVPDWEKAVSAAFAHDWTNLAFFENTTSHLHAHLIPRYNTPKEAYGIEFIDPNPKGNYSPYPHQELEGEVLIKIKEDIKTWIS